MAQVSTDSYMPLGSVPGYMFEAVHRLVPFSFELSIVTP